MDFRHVGELVRKIEPEDVSEVTAKLKNWYPDIIVGSESRHLNADFYNQETFLVESAEDKNIYPFKITFHGKIVGIHTIAKDPEAMTVTSNMGALDPNYRGAGIANIAPQVVEQIGRAIGAGLAYYFVTLKIPQQQLGAEKNGYQIVGIVPAFDRDMVSPGSVKRVYEAIYAKVLVDSSEVCIPLKNSLTHKTKALWDFLFDERLS